MLSYFIALCLSVIFKKCRNLIMIPYEDRNFSVKDPNTTKGCNSERCEIALW